MNYEVFRDLTPEQMAARKKSLKMPAKCYSFNRDILDLMVDHETQTIFTMQGPGHHDSLCKAAKSSDMSENCCEPVIKTYNQYAQQVYKDQPIELPLELGPSSNRDTCDMVSQISSQFSDSSRGTNCHR